MSVTTQAAPKAVPLLRPAAIPLLAFLAFCILAASLAILRDYPSAFDELEHVSYAGFLQETGTLRPMFEAMHTFPRTSLLYWDDRLNYLGHPSPYYWYETLFLDRSLPFHQAISRVRLGSVALVASGVGLALWAGWRSFASDKLALTLFCLGVALCPKLLAVSYQVTNDALAVLAGALGYWGLAMERRHRLTGPVAVALAMAFALLAKPNAALAIGAALGLAALLRLRQRPALMLALAAGSALGSVPYWFIVAKYGAVVPITVEQFGGVRQIPDFARFLPAFLFILADTFGFDQTGAWPIPGLAALLCAALVWAMIAVAGLGGGLAAQRPGTPDTTRLLAIIGPLAFVAVFPVHLWFSAGRLGGSLPAASFRYYLPIWPFIVHAIAYAAALAGPRLRWAVAALVLSTLAVGWTSV